MNKWCGTGRLTKDPDIRATSDTNVARFTIACDRRFKKDGENADFISCVGFGKTAEFIEKYVRKGTKLEIVGRIQTGSYEKDGREIYTTDVVVEEANFAESKKASEERKSAETETDGFINVSLEDAGELPFA